MPKKTKSKVEQTGIVVDSYRVLAECVERGVSRGWGRAHKHTLEPSSDVIKEEINNCVLGEICEYFSFPTGDRSV